MEAGGGGKRTGLKAHLFGGWNGKGGAKAGPGQHECMMELAHNIHLNEEALNTLVEEKKAVFVFEWLRFLDKVLSAAQRSDIRDSQPKLVAQLLKQINESPGPPTRKLLARCLATIFSIGDTQQLFKTVGTCNEIIRNRDDSPSFLPRRLAAITCVGALYEKLGRMVGRTYEETVQGLLRALKNAESQGRTEIMSTMEKVMYGLGSAGTSVHKDVYRAASKLLVDRSMTVRCAAAKCMVKLVQVSSFVAQIEVETLVSVCFRSLDSSIYDVRCCIGTLLGFLLATNMSQKPTAASTNAKNKRLKPLDAFNLLATGFVKGVRSSSGMDLIRGHSTINREIRVGVTHAYVNLVQFMGGVWLERQLAPFLQHVTSLAANPRATATHVDAVYARRCIVFILSATVGSLLGEKAQVNAARELSSLVHAQMNLVGADTSGDPSQSAVAQSSQHVLICCLQALGTIIQDLGTTASELLTEQNNEAIQPVLSALTHPMPSARLSAAWCLRRACVALPSLLAPLLERCMEQLEALKSSQEAVTGHTFALCALLGSVRFCPLGIPHSIGKKVFNTAEDLLRSTSQNGRLSIPRTQSGWLILGSVMTLGSAMVKQHLPRLLLLWRGAFPKSIKELEEEKARGDHFTWQISLESRAGALASMDSFVRHCPDLLVGGEVRRRLNTPLECALLLLQQIPSIVKAYGAHLKASGAMLQYRLYTILCSLHATSMFDSNYKTLFRELVAEFTLTDNPANTTTSLLRTLCHHDDSIILGSWLQETDHKAIEDQLQPNSASGSGALEHDATFLYTASIHEESMPLPLGVAVIDSSVRLFGLIFPSVSDKHKVQMLTHFRECIKQAKSARQQAIQMNIFSAVLNGLKTCAIDKKLLGSKEVRKACLDLILDALASPSPILRCAGGEALGRMTQCCHDNKFVGEMAQRSFEILRSARDIVSRTGHSLALGCLHRYAGGVNSGPHLNTSVSILKALGNDFSSPVVQVWSLHALGLITDSGGPLFRSYVEPTLALVLHALLTVSPAHTDVHQCLGKCLSALITTIGPELQGNSAGISDTRLSCLVCCAVMQDHTDSLVQAQAISCLQQLHMFAPRHVNLSSLVPHLCTSLASPHLLLRRAAVACLRQLAQREANAVSEHALKLYDPNADPSASSNPGLGDNGSSTADCIEITETGLEGALFRMLDREKDERLRKGVLDTLTSMLQSLAGENLPHWFKLVRNVLSAATDLTKSLEPEPPEAAAGGDENSGDEDDEGDIDAQFKATDKEVKSKLAPKWLTRVFAVSCMRTIMQVCKAASPAHIDLITAKKLKRETPSADYLVLHLSELIRVAFIAATSDSDKLRLAGLDLLQDVIKAFARVSEPEFPSHVILEQYQAQVSAALRPAFSKDTPSDVTAAACEVCSTWIKSGVAQDLNDLRRVHQLLASSLEKLKEGGVGPSATMGPAGGVGQGGRVARGVYSESASTMEKLAVIKAWAEVYIEAVNREMNGGTGRPPVSEEERTGELTHNYGGSLEDRTGRSSGESLLSLVDPELGALAKLWLAVLRDHALLSVPADSVDSLPPEGGTFYTNDTRDSTRAYYKDVWPSCLYAGSLYLNRSGFGVELATQGTIPASKAGSTADTQDGSDRCKERFHLLLGISVEALCSRTSSHPDQHIIMCLRALRSMLSSEWPRSELSSRKRTGKMITPISSQKKSGYEAPPLARELLNVLHRLLLTRESVTVQHLAIRVVQLVVGGAKDVLVKAIEQEKDSGEEGEGVDCERDLRDDVSPGESVVFACLEVCLCVLVRHIPAINSSLTSSGIYIGRKQAILDSMTSEVLAASIKVLGELPQLCSKKGRSEAVPIIFHMITSVIRELSPVGKPNISPAVSTAIFVLKSLFSVGPVSGTTGEYSEEDVSLVQSTLLSLVDSSATPMESGVLVQSLITLALVCPPTTLCNSTVKTAVTSKLRELWKASNDVKFRETYVKCVTQVFHHKCVEVSHMFIKALAPDVFDYLTALSTALIAASAHPSAGVSSTRPEELTVATQCIMCIEILVNLAEEKNKLTLVALVLSVLSSFLLTEESSNSQQTAALARSIHQISLQSMLRVARDHPTAAKALLASSPAVKSRLEGALKLGRKQEEEEMAKAKAAAARRNQAARPTIQLKSFGKAK